MQSRWSTYCVYRLEMQLELFEENLFQFDELNPLSQSLLCLWIIKGEVCNLNVPDWTDQQKKNTNLHIVKTCFSLQLKDGWFPGICFLISEEKML